MPICHKRVKIRSSPWMCSQITNLIKERDKLKNKIYKLKFELLEENNAVLRKLKEELYEQSWINYKKLFRKKLVTSKVRKRKRSYYSEKLSSANSSSDVWNVLKSIMPKSKFKQSDISKISQDVVKTEQFNKYFAKVGEDLAANIPHVPPIPFHGNVKSFSLRQVSENEVIKVLCGMKNKKSIGTDGIPMYILKLSAPVIIPSLTHIINTSLSRGVMPLHWKEAKVVPIFKSGDKTHPSNYRPIAILSSASKIIEKLVQIQLTNHLKINNLLSSEQSGFRENHSTVTSLVRVTDEWLLATDNGLYTGVVFIDMRKAFDTVDPCILFKKTQIFWCVR